jgi:hypothetical protein
MMRLALAALLLRLAAVSAGDVKPVVEGEHGKRAFDDLGHFYRNPNKVPDQQSTFDALKKGEPKERRRAAEYLLALLKQSYADETNGRLPPADDDAVFGADSLAESYRFWLIGSLDEDVKCEEALDIARWLLESERTSNEKLTGIRVLRRIKGKESDAVLRKLLDPPHPIGDAVVAAVEESGARGVKDVGPALRTLAVHHRAKVREAAHAAAAKLKLGPLPDFDPEKTFPPWLDKQLRSALALLPVRVPKDARWVDIEPRPGIDSDRDSTSGWLLSSEGATYRLIDWFGVEIEIDKTKYAFKNSRLSDAARRLRAAQSDERRLPFPESEHGRRSESFNPYGAGLPR